MGLFSRRQHTEPVLPEGMRVYAIGDIHGRLDLFDRLLSLIEEDTHRRPSMPTTIILLGDLIDRGPDSAGVIRRAMNPPAWARMRVIKGNHEAAMLDALGGDRKMLGIWTKNGGIQALQSWGIDDALIENGTSEELIAAMHQTIPLAERAWLARGVVSIQLGGYYFVHAGVRPGVKLGEQKEQDSFWIREEFLLSNRDHGAIVVHGHSVSTDIEELPNRIGIDTGAYASGKLTALCLEADKRWILQT
jgi:serine/threonine protein phosphatase 1